MVSFWTKVFQVLYLNSPVLTDYLCYYYIMDE